jgi:hypothetical protein
VRSHSSKLDLTEMAAMVFTDIVRCTIIGMRAILKVAVAALLGALPAWSQDSGVAQPQLKNPPRFEDFPVTSIFNQTPVAPILTTPDEKKFETVIGDGVSKGWGVFDGATGKESSGPGPNFAGHYILVSFGCGSLLLTDCLMAAIVDAKTGHIFPLPSPSGSVSMPYFGVDAEFSTNHPPFSFHSEPGENGAYNHLPFRYRLNSRLLTARICEGAESAGGSIAYSVPIGCGDHFYVMGENGLTLVYRELDDDNYTPRFEEYSVMAGFDGPPAALSISTPEENKFQTRIRDGVAKGYGVKGSDGKERPGPNFAGHFFLITWGCGSSCLMAAIVDGKTGRVYPPPFHHGPGDSHFRVPWELSATHPFEYRVDSRLLIANICEQDRILYLGNLKVDDKRCGPHYFLIDEDGLTLIHRFRSADPTIGIFRPLKP